MRRACMVPDCDRPHMARGYCKRHYQLEINHGRINLAFTGWRFGAMKQAHEPDPHQRPTLLDIAWAAGIFEGEGNAQPTGNSTSLGVAQKQRWILDRLRALFGGSVFLQNRIDGRNRKRYTIYHWKLYGGRARGFLMTIFTFLSPHRRLQAIAAVGRMP